MSVQLLSLMKLALPGGMACVVGVVGLLGDDSGAGIDGSLVVPATAGWWTFERILLLALAVSLAGTGLLAQRLSSSRRRLTSQVTRNAGLLEALDEGLLAVDGAGRVILANSRARRYLEAGSGDPVGKPLARVSRLPALAATIDQARRAGGRVSYETTAAEQDEHRIVRIVAGSIPGPDGLCIVAVRDMTEMRRLEKVRSDFVANVSHELKTPLTSMRGFVEAVLDDPEMPHALRTQFLDKARHSTERLSAIVTDLLSLTRIESASGRLEAEPVEFAELVAECVAAISEDAEARGVSLVLPEGRPEGEVQGDLGALTLAVSNLLDNAVKYSPQGGSVTVEVRGEPGWIVLSIEDEGPGIPIPERERVFERFYRVDKVRSRELGGTGLGLSIVKNVALTHQGKVEVESAPGGGSRFLLRLPVTGEQGASDLPM